MFHRMMQAMTLAGFVSTWLQSARADGKITLEEVSELLRMIGQILDIRELEELQIEVPPGQAGPQSLRSLGTDY